MTTSAAPRERFDWEEAVQQDRDLQRIDAFVNLTVSKFPGQPPPSADAGRGGSRYQPAPPPAPIVKAEQRPTMGTMSASTSAGSTSQFIDIRDYQSESSSEMDTREVNPMDELSDFESETSQQQQVEQMEQDQEQDQGQELGQPMDVEMEEEEEEEEEEDEEEKQTVCEVCKSSDRESEIMLCDDCDAEYHIFCLDPPLPKVPEGTWYCPKCKVKYPATATVVSVKEEQARTAAASGGTSENAAASQTTAPTANSDAVAISMTGPSGQAPDSGNAQANGAGGDDPTSIPIAQALEGDPDKSNSLLIHACNCDDVKCTDSEFQVFCPHMKRFLRSVCWASHSDKWRSYRLARITAELFAYHAMNCQLPQCNVPLCVKIREEEIV